MINCENCRRYKKSCTGGLAKEQCEKIKLPQTNADRIRSMTDEELAEQLYLLRLDALRLEGFEGFIETKDEVLDWLKEEASE